MRDFFNYFPCHTEEALKPREDNNFSGDEFHRTESEDDTDNNHGRGILFLPGASSDPDERDRKSVV